MESLGDILKRLQRQSTSSDGADIAEPPEEEESPGCPLCGGLGWVRPEVPVGHPEFGKAQPCRCQQQANEEQRLARLQRFSNMGLLTTVTFGGTDPNGRGTSPESRGLFRAALEMAQAYTESPQGWLTLMGGSGTGKTHLAAAVANRCMERSIPVFFAVVPDLLDYLRTSFDPQKELSYDEFLEQVKTVPLLILDDLGVQSNTPWAQEKLFQVLNHRYMSQRPTIITTNIPLEQMEARVQSRLTDPRLARVVDLGPGAQGAGRSIGGVPAELLAHMTFESFEPTGKATDKQGRETLAAALAAATSFAQEPQGWVVLMGDSGCGKTHLAVAIANERLKAAQSVFFAFVPDLLDHLRYTFSPDSRVTYDQLFEAVKQTPLLVLDDLGAESSTAWVHEKLYQVIVHRHNARLPTVITTRAIPSGDKDPIASRLNDPRLVVVVPVTAPDYRQQTRPKASAEHPRGTLPSRPNR